jgi:hypothetical protein
MSKKNCIFSAFLVKNEFLSKFDDTEWFVENLWTQLCWKGQLYWYISSLDIHWIEFSIDFWKLVKNPKNAGGECALWEPFQKGGCRYETVLIYQPPNAHVQISWILQRNGSCGREKDLYFLVPILLHAPKNSTIVLIMS